MANSPSKVAGLIGRHAWVALRKARRTHGNSAVRSYRLWRARAAKPPRR